MGKITVFYDAVCPICRKDQRLYERLAGKGSVIWCDITSKDAFLRQKGIEPLQALTSLHVQACNGEIVKDVDAYILLFSQIVWLKPVAFVLNMPWVKTVAQRWYRRSVMKRLAREGRLP